MPILVRGIDSLPTFTFDNNKSDEMLTYFTQEMLREGFLAHGQCYLMLSHSDVMINKYKKACEKVFRKISKIFYKNNQNYKKYINGNSSLIFLHPSLKNIANYTNAKFI